MNSWIEIPQPVSSCILNSFNVAEDSVAIVGAVDVVEEVVVGREFTMNVAEGADVVIMVAAAAGEGRRGFGKLRGGGGRPPPPPVVFFLTGSPM